MMAQLLSNPNLDGFRTVTFFTDNENNTGAIEYPDNWEFVYTPMHPEDPNRIPQSLHRDRGFSISAGRSEKSDSVFQFISSASSPSRAINSLTLPGLVVATRMLGLSALFIL